MVERVYLEFKKKENGKKVKTELLGRTFDYGDRVDPSDLGISVNEAEKMAAESGGDIEIIRKKR